jgi:imidazolonepropionase-like amidohydrolase
MESNAEYALISDHPVIVSTSLRDTLKFFMIQGMSDVEAISLITRNPARILGIDKYLGTLEKGKWASLVVWDKDPLHLSSFPKMVMAEGKVIRKRK